jgi:hypothetical protein
MLVTFKDIKFLFVNYIINALPVDFRSFINKTNIVADFFLNNVTVIKWAATCRECSSQEIYRAYLKEAWEN